MDKTRLAQRISDFRKAVFRLEAACQQPENEFVRDSVIQRFEFSYELAWKMLKLKLEEEDIDARSPKQILQEALILGLIEDGNQWTELHKMRNLTSHTYDEALAQTVYRFVKETGLGLLKTLSETSNHWLKE